MEHHAKPVKPVHIYIDTDAFVAFVKKDDTNHKRAVSLFHYFEQQPVTFRTSNYVFSEVVTVLSQRVSHSAAVAFIQTITAPSSPITIHWIDELIEQSAIEIFKNQTSKDVSFVDCINMALLNQEGLDTIFSFDEHYKKNGYSLFATKLAL